MSDTYDQAYLKKLTILYVEDEELTREMTSQFLARITKGLITAENGREGVEAFRTHKPDIILTDIQMPVMDGLTMAGEIRDMDKMIPIIILTAFCNADFLNKANSLNVDRFVIKPVDGSLLHDALLACAHRLMIEKQLKLAQNMLHPAT